MCRRTRYTVVQEEGVFAGRAVAISHDIILVAAVPLDIVSAEINVVLMWLDCGQRACHISSHYRMLSRRGIKQTFTVIEIETGRSIPRLVCTTPNAPWKTETVDKGGPAPVADLVSRTRAQLATASTF